MHSGDSFPEGVVRAISHPGMGQRPFSRSMECNNLVPRGIIDHHNFILWRGVAKAQILASGSLKHLCRNCSTDPASIFRMRFGVVNVNFLVSLPDMSSRNGVIAHTLLVNTPQLVLSFSYFAYNAIWTHMPIAHEWAQFGLKRQGLRVSSPAGQQRGNHFLTIPCQYAIPLQTMSAVLHWLLSQSFFLARIN